MLPYKRKSHFITGRIYFWTATIHQWHNILLEKEQKEVIIRSFQYLSDKEFVQIYAFVIMPNHIHVIWKVCTNHGTETPLTRFLKYTAHELLKFIRQRQMAAMFEVKKTNKQHEIWQRDSLAVEVYSKAVADQKLGYIHVNPVKGKWKLADDDLDYYYSSARFYEYGLDEFGFLNNLYDVVGRID